MDPESARLVRDEIARLKSSKRTLVLCSHNLTEVEVLADQIAIIYRGRILKIGTLDELKMDVLGLPEYEIKFSRDWDSGGLEFPAGVSLLSRTSNALHIRVEKPQELNSVLIDRLSAMAAPVMAFQEQSRTLEQVYLKVMAGAKGNVNVH
jgi:ABC-2 type transport system ATP-binding protein